MARPTFRAAAFTLIEIVIVVCILTLLMLAALPSLSRARRTSQQTLCVTNLRQIVSAKETWAVEQQKANGDSPTDADLFGDRLYLIRKPACPAGGNYSLGNVGTFPTCT